MIRRLQHAGTEAGAPAASRDLRAHLEALEQHGKLVRATRPIDKDTELHPLVRWQFRGLPRQAAGVPVRERHRSAGTPVRHPVVVGALAGSEEIYALGLGCQPGEIPTTGSARWRRRSRR